MVRRSFAVPMLFGAAALVVIGFAVWFGVDANSLQAPEYDELVGR